MGSGLVGLASGLVVNALLPLGQFGESLWFSLVVGVVAMRVVASGSGFVGLASGLVVNALLPLGQFGES